MKRVAAGIFSLTILGAQSPAGMNSLTAIRHWPVGEVTRVAVEVSGNFEFLTDRLHNPERVYYDILNTRPYIHEKRAYSEQIDDRLLSRVRVAETKPGVTRVVLDLNGFVDATASQLSNPARLIIELRRGTPQVGLPDPPAIPAAVPGPISKLELPASAATDTASIKPSSQALEEPAKIGALERPASAAEPPGRATLPEKPARLATLPAGAIKPANRTSSGETSLVRALGLKISRVVIDAGHGGHDQGTAGPRGLLEKDLVLDITLRVGKLVEDRMGAEVIYTRTNDTFIPLEGRTALANEKKADLFLSIHANSSSSRSAGGVETYYLNFADSREALDLAARENASSQKSVFELRDIIQQITRHEKAEESREFARRVQDSLQAFSARSFPGIRNRGVKKAPFVVLVGASMPSILAEIGFVSNPREEALLKKADYRQKLADALFRGVQRYAESLSHHQVARAKE
jgi:N-acetylmuramoyl-L-alanine amidase